MSSVNLDFTPLGNTNPYPPPLDWLSVGQVQAKIFGSAFVSTSAANAIYIYDKPCTGLITSSIVLGSIASDSLGIAFCSSAGDGYQLLLRNTDARLFKVATDVDGYGMPDAVDANGYPMIGVDVNNVDFVGV